jgi:hypothetical protein
MAAARVEGEGEEDEDDGEDEEEGVGEGVEEGAFSAPMSHMSML